jgi:hypothetical protein
MNMTLYLLLFGLCRSDSNKPYVGKQERVYQIGHSAYYILQLVAKAEYRSVRTADILYYVAFTFTQIADHHLQNHPFSSYG